MNECAIVVNAGSSSLKFSVFVRPEDGLWQLWARGQIDGIGTAPRLAAKDAQGTMLVDEQLGSEVCDGHAAVKVLAHWLRSKDQGARIVGVGHRVVHGGAQYRWGNRALCQSSAANQRMDGHQLAEVRSPGSLYHR
jgi:acetate kinase